MRDMNSTGEFDSQSLLTILKRCAGLSIAVVGDLMLDEYVDGTVERISPEAPVPIVRAQGNEFRLGGAANVARQIAALGAKVCLVGVVGDDAAGHAILRLCEESGIGTQGILTAKERQTTRKLRVLSQSQQLLRIDWEDARPCSEADSELLLASVRNSVPLDALILSDYAKGVLTGPFTLRLMRERRADTRVVVVDPKHRDWSRYRGATVITPNLRELSDAAGLPLDPA